jgi:hypothetical protein
MLNKWFRDSRYDALLDRLASVAQMVVKLNERVAQLELEGLSNTEDAPEPLDKLLTTEDGLLSYKKLLNRRNGEDDN